MAPYLVDRLREAVPNVMFSDGFGSSETGIQGSRRFAPGEEIGDEVKFSNVESGTVLFDEHGEIIPAGSTRVGQVAHSGYVPLRYLNAPEKTAQVFIEKDGTRYVLSGDLGVMGDDGSVVLLGRGSSVINTGGEKVHAEEVESQLKSHPGVYDALVVGVPDERWGQRVVAVIEPVEGHTPDVADVDSHLRGRLASYKIPKAVVLVDEIARSPSGKADYRWAKDVAATGTTA